jgi:predicted nucleic acid-binding protein
MSDIRTDLIALDTNVCIYAIKEDRRSCEDLVYRHLNGLRIIIAPQVLAELQRNLSSRAIASFFKALQETSECARGYFTVPHYLVEKYERLGAKKGDAVIAAELELACARFLFSENRHFLSEIEDLPFKVLTSAEALAILRSGE